MLIEMVYRGEKIDSFSEKQTTDNLVLQADDFHKVFEKWHMEANTLNKNREYC